MLAERGDRQIIYKEYNCNIPCQWGKTSMASSGTSSLFPKVQTHFLLFHQRASQTLSEHHPHCPTLLIAPQPLESYDLVSDLSVDGKGIPWDKQDPGEEAIESLSAEVYNLLFHTVIFLLRNKITHGAPFYLCLIKFGLW